MQASQPNLFLRDDTLLGVCQGIGDDFGFNPLWLRIAFAAALIWNPVYDVSAYLALGAVVLVSRLIVRNPRSAKRRRRGRGAGRGGQCQCGGPAGRRLTRVGAGHQGGGRRRLAWRPQWSLYLICDLYLGE